MTLYIVNDGHKIRLIEAHTRAGARSFAAQKSIKVDKATATEAHKLAAIGTEIENAQPDTETENMFREVE
jgi:hypothetical protein